MGGRGRVWGSYTGNEINLGLMYLERGVPGKRENLGGRACIRWDFRGKVYGLEMGTGSQHKGTHPYQCLEKQTWEMRAFERKLTAKSI